MDDGVGLLKPKLNLASLNSKVLISEPLLVVYEHIQKLRERGQGVEADHMDDSDDVTKYCETSGSKATAKSFNAVWAAKDFRAALYDAVAAKSGGPVWLRDSIKVTDAEGMSLTRIPHVRPFSYPIGFRPRADIDPDNRCGTACSKRPRP